MQRTALVSCLILGLHAVAWSAPSAGSPPVVLVLAGQSNMVGQGNRAELDAARRQMPDTVELIVAGRPVGSSDTGAFGPELSLAHELAAAMPGRRFKLLKFARGSTSIRVWAPAWSEEAVTVTENKDVGPLYPRLLDFLRQHLTEADGAPHAILWFQGERDARYAAAASDYGLRLDEFIASLRRDLAAPDAWFILGEVNPPYPHTSEVAAVQRATPDRVPRTLSVLSDGLTKKKDGVHYDTAGTWELGRRFARELLPTLSAASAPASR